VFLTTILGDEQSPKQKEIVTVNVTSIWKIPIILIIKKKYKL
jgi:hypothetical protein